MLRNGRQPAAEVSWQSRRWGNGGYLARTADRRAQRLHALPRVARKLVPLWQLVIQHLRRRLCNVIVPIWVCNARFALRSISSTPVYKWLMGAQMPAAHDPLLKRITIDSDVRFGKACIRGHWITVDFLAVYAYAAELAAGNKVFRG
jgi:hypothetical protein